MPTSSPAYQPLDIEIQDNLRSGFTESGQTNQDILTSSFPPEICVQIFLETLPDIKTLDRSSHHHSFCGPLILSWVCRRWREFVHCNPELWEQITLFLKDDRKWDNISTLVSEWMERAGSTRPLSVAIILDPPVLPLEQHARCAIMDILSHISQRSHRLLFFSMSAHAHYINYLSFQPQGAATLQSLHLDFNPEDSNLFSTPQLWLCDPRPRPKSMVLRNLRLFQLSKRGLDTTESGQLLLVDLKVLTSLTLIQVTLTDCDKLMQLARSLEILNISRLGEFHMKTARVQNFGIPSNGVSNPVTVHQALVELTIHGAPLSQCCYILDAYTLPCLRRFTYRHNNANSRDRESLGLFPSLIHHIQRGMPQLLSINLDSIHCQGDFKTMIGSLMAAAGQTLVDLTLEHVADSVEAPLQVIEAIFGDLSLLPELRSLRIFSPADECMQSVRNLVDSAHALAVRNQRPVAVAVSTTPDWFENGIWKDQINPSEALDTLAKLNGGNVTCCLLVGRELAKDFWSPDADATNDMMDILKRMSGQNF